VWDATGRNDPERVASVIAELDVDVAALQEFTYPLDVAIETRTPVVLTSLDSYHCALGPTRETSRHCFGNVLLTRHPIRHVHRLDLSRRTPRASRRAGGHH
jgi:endonuclease/exonuclease/phosphatase family metal-dependent hydrolase